MSETIDIPGLSGKVYRYWFQPKLADAILQAVGGNYVFLKRQPNGQFSPLYFGEAGDLSSRIPGHERWRDAMRLGVTHLAAHTTPAGEAARCAEERDLIQRWNPSLNAQLRTLG